MTTSTASYTIHADDDLQFVTVCRDDGAKVSATYNSYLHLRQQYGDLQRVCRILWGRSKP